MAKPATRMQAIVPESFSEQQYPQSLPVGQAQSRMPAVTSATSDAAPQRQLSEDSSCAIEPDSRSDLLAAIEDQVIPRLLIAHDLMRGPEAFVRKVIALPTTADALELARLAVQSDLQRSLELALAMLGSGLTLETIFLELIAPAARRLGSDWEEDLRSFTEVTVGLGTLHELVHVLVPATALAPSGCAPRPLEHPPRGRVLLLGGPGEQHTLGLNMFGELLRHQRWSVLIELAMPSREVLNCVRAQPIDAVGFSVSSPERLWAAAELIASIKRSARTRTIDVLVGGPVNLASEVERLGATFCADAPEAVRRLSARFDAKTLQLLENVIKAAR
jgi:MerR family transcriptional regulator, light-induced transcriptional regulator